MTDRYERIREALAMGPTPGPWEALSNFVRTHPIQGEMGGFLVAECPANIGRELEDAAYITACDPDTIRELLAERDQLAAALEAAREDAERYRWLRDREIPEWLDLWHQNPDRIDAAIDQARGKGVQS